MQKVKAKSRIPKWPSDLQFFMQNENNSFLSSIRCQTIADIMNDKDLDTAYPNGGLGKLIEKLRHLVCMAAFSQNANKELGLGSLQEAIESIFDLCRHVYNENYMDFTDKILIDEFYEIYDRLRKMEYGIEEHEAKFLPTLIHRNLLQAVENLQSETIG